MRSVRGARTFLSWIARPASAWWHDVVLCNWQTASGRGTLIEWARERRNPSRYRMPDPQRASIMDTHSSPLIARGLFDTSPFSAVLYDPRGHVLAVNAAFERMWGVSKATMPPGYSVLEDEQLVGQGALPLIRRAFAGEAVVTPPLRHDIGAVSTTGVGRTFWTEGHFWPLCDATGTVINVVLMHIEVTARVEAERALLERATQHEQQEEEAATLNHELHRTNEELRNAMRQLTEARDVGDRERARLRLVAEAGAILASSLDPHGTVQRVAEIVVPHFADWCVVDVIDDNGVLEPLAVAHGDSEKVARTFELRRLYPSPPDAPTGPAAVVRSQRSEMYADISDDIIVRASRNAEHLQLLRDIGLRSVILVPLSARGRPLGVLQMCMSGESGRRFTHADLTTAEEIGWRAGLALDNAQLFRSQSIATETMTRLQRATAALASVMTPSGVADAVLTQGMEALGADDGVLCLLSADGQWLEIAGQIGLPADVARVFARFPVTASLPLSDAVRDGVPVLLADKRAVVERYPELRDRNAAAATEAWAAMPLRVGDSVVGGVAFGFKTAKRFSADERAFLDALTMQSAQALERVRLIESERSARAEAEQANHTKMEFLATMSHELRTPLNAIGGYAQLLEMEVRGPINDAQRKDIERLRRSQQALVRLVDDVLNFAKIEAGSVEFRTQAVPLGVALSGLEAMVAPQVSARGLSYVVRVPAREITVLADLEKFEQIMLNLLSNAVKFTESGTVEVSAEERDGSAHIAVRDTGIGVAADKLELIFDPFFQVQSGYTRRASGTGLGLAISRDLARRMGGDLTATSTPGVGSTFVLRLPLET